MSFLFGACFNKRKYKRRSKRNHKLRMEIQKIILKAVTIVQEARALNDNDFSTDFEPTYESIQFNHQEEGMSTNPDFDIIEKSAFYNEAGMVESLLGHEIQINDAILTPYSKPPIFTFGSQPEIIERGKKAAGYKYSHLQFSSLEKELGYCAVRKCSNSIKRANELLPDYEMCKDITEWHEHEDEIKYGVSETTMSESTSIQCYGHFSDKSAEISENYQMEPFSKYQAIDITEIRSSVPECRVVRKCPNSIIGAKELLPDYQICKDITEWREHDEIKHEVSETTRSESKPIEFYGHLSEKSDDISENFQGEPFSKYQTNDIGVIISSDAGNAVNRRQIGTVPDQSDLVCPANKPADQGVNFQLEPFGEYQVIDIGEIISSDTRNTVERRQIVTVSQPDLFCPVNKPAEQGDMGDSDSEVESNSNSEINAAMGDTEVNVYDMRNEINNIDMPGLKMRHNAMMDFAIVSGMDLQINARPHVFKALRKRSYSDIGIST